MCVFVCVERRDDDDEVEETPEEREGLCSFDFGSKELISNQLSLYGEG